MQNKINKKLFKLLRYVIPFILIVWMIIINPWKDFANRLASVSLYLIFLGVAINFGLIFTLKAWRWRIAIPSPPAFFKIYASQLEGQLANILVGMGVADFVRSSRLRKDEKGTFPEDFGTAVADRACEYLSLSILFALSSLTPWVSLYWLLAPLVYIAVLSLILLKPNFLQNKTIQWPKIHRLVKSIHESLTPKHMTYMVLISFLGWLSEVFLLMIMLKALSLPASLGLAVLILVGINVAIAIPGPPANLGTFETGAILAMTSVGISSEAALSFALFYHGFHVISTSLVGSVIWFGRNVFSR
ncbi:MAG: lysylphosphatidylglycerol synthase transmembrane domain-containing protein [bacterium]|nr:flippase-like domain-containing protein [bacterium]